ncbi:MAG: CvpA family protein [Bacteroidales bacterium]|nr:CvpA family protein [Bacteroidales bacterium]MBN2764131.1 CvpA family protein [Bacteroidales bacterium]
MNGIDIAILVIVIIALIRGLMKGFIMQLAALVALILGIYVSIHFSSYLSEILSMKVKMDPAVIRWLSFGLLFTLVVVAVHFTGKLVEKLLKMTALSFLNRLAGGLFAGIKTIFILAVLVTFINAINKRVQFIPAEKTADSVFYKPLSGLIPLLFPRFFKNNEKPDEKPEAKPVDVNDIVVDLEKSSIIKAKYYLCENFSYDLG